MNFNKKLVFAFAVLLNITYICAKAHSKCGEEHVPIPGGTSPLCDSKTLGEVETHAKHAVSQLRHTDGSACTFKDIVEPTKQVVSGMLYKAEVHHDCGGHVKKCHLKIWSQPWMPNPNKLSWECDEYKNHKISKRGTPGGHKPLEDLTKATELARQETAKQPGCELVKVKSGATQVVQGKMYHLKTEVKCNNQKRECNHKIVERLNHEVATKEFDCKNI